MKRRTYLKSAGTVTAGGLLAGCASNEDGGPEDEGDNDDTPRSEDGSESDDESSGDEGEETTSDERYGALSTLVTDQPTDIDDFESLVVTVAGIWVKPSQTATGADADGGEDEENDGENAAEESEDDGETGTGRRYREFEEPQQADLVQLQDGNAAVIDEWELETGEYQFLQLHVANTEGTLTSGDEATVETPGNAPLKFNTSFEIRSEERTRFVADFAPNRTGQGRYIIRPVAQGTTVLYGDEAYETGDEESDDEESGTDESRDDDEESADNN